MTQGLTQELVADVLVNLFGAAGLLIGAVALRRGDPRGPLTLRIVLALHVAALLFLVRSIAWIGGSIVLDRAVAAIASLVPLCALLVTEGMLRRHAPRWLKAALAFGSLALAALHLSGLVDGAHGGFVLMVQVVGSLCALAVLMLRRDRASLTAVENRGVERLIVVTAVLAALAATDFRTLFPHVPVRFGALGALVLLYVSLSPEGLSAPGRVRALTLALWAAIGIVLAFGFVAVQGDFDWLRIVRVAAVALAALILAALLSEHVAGIVERSRPVPALLLARDAEDFERGLRAHALFADAKILDGQALADVDDEAFAGLLARQPVLRRSRAPWGLPATDPGVERARSLMTAYGASHLALLSHSPLRVLALSLPSIAADPRTESEIELARRIGQAVYAGAPA
jgi:hypothetical protein